MMTPRFDIATLFPEMCSAVLSESIIGRAVKAGKLEINFHNIRDYSANKWNRVDDYTYGGGMGMLMQAEPIYRCYEAAKQTMEAEPLVIYMSPEGTPLKQELCNSFAETVTDRPLFIICGHYEGIDQRVIDEIVDMEVSIGDYVLTGGELGAMVLVDSVGRLCEGVLSNESCFTEESHYNGLLEYPQYTKPSVWHDKKVPDVLLSGHHENIEKWRHEKALENTYFKRPDMLKSYELSKKDIKFLESLKR